MQRESITSWWARQSGETHTICEPFGVCCNTHNKLHTHLQNTHTPHVHIHVHTQKPSTHKYIHTCADNYCIKRQWQCQVCGVSGTSRFLFSLCNTQCDWDTLDIHVHVVCSLKHTRMTALTDKHPELKNPSSSPSDTNYTHISWSSSTSGTSVCACVRLNSWGRGSV